VKRKTDEWDVTGPAYGECLLRFYTHLSQTQIYGFENFKPSGRIKQDVGMESKDEELIISLKDLPGLHCSEVKRLAKLQAKVDDDGF